METRNSVFEYDGDMVFVSYSHEGTQLLDAKFYRPKVSQTAATYVNINGVSVPLNPSGPTIHKPQLDLEQIWDHDVAQAFRTHITPKLVERRLKQESANAGS